MEDEFLKMIEKNKKPNKKILIRNGKVCGVLGDEERFYKNMQTKTKKSSLSDAINK